MRRWSCALLLVTAGCSRDLTLPPEVPPGSVSGRVLLAVPGRSERTPAAGAGVSLLGSGLTCATNAGGTFKLDGVEVTEGLLHLRFDSDGDGAVDRQRVVQLADYGTGPRRAVNLGDLVLGENATVHGRVVRGDLGAAKSGHSGTAVFVPEGPFTAFTNDDGSFLLPNLPVGPLQFYVFRAGYTPLALGSVDLRSGEDYGFREVTLEVSTQAQLPGEIVGRLLFLPPAAGMGDTRVTALGQGQAVALEAAVEDDARFRIAPAPPDLYTLIVTRSGYGEARVQNVLVLPDKTVELGLVALTDAPAPDAGQPPPFDAGLPPPDGGAQPGDGGVCALNADCALTDWCDDGLCRKQCRSTGDCTNARVCDPATRTCVASCTQGCPSGTTCEAATNLCRAACSAAFPCGSGFLCVGSQCKPECTVAADCGAHRTCQAGQCRADGTCDDDLDCPADRLCALGACGARPSTRLDGGAGPFSCTDPCQCRADEWCQAGRCQSAALPTRYFAADGGPQAPADLFAAMADAGPGERLALRAGDTFGSELPFFVQASNVAVRGGYKDCGERWVRGDGERTTLWVDGGTVVRVTGSSSVLADQVALSNLQLATNPTAADCGANQLAGSYTRRLEVSLVNGSFPANSCGGGYQALVYCAQCEAARLADVTLEASGHTVTTLVAASLAGSDGLVERATVAPQPGAVFGLYAVLVSGQTGPTTIRAARLGAATVSTTSGGVSLYSCGNHPTRVEGGQFVWPADPSGSGFTGIGASFCNNLLVADNVIDGSATTGATLGGGTGLSASYAAGEFARNTVLFPATSAALYGVAATYPTGPLALRDNVVRGGTAPCTVWGLYLVGASLGPITVAGNRVEVAAATVGAGLYLSAMTPASALTVTDNTLEVAGNGIGDGNRLIALWATSSSGVFERNRAYAAGSSWTIAARFEGQSQIELYANHLWAGANTSAGGYGTHALEVDNAAQVMARGNTVVAEGSTTQPGHSAALVCNYPTTTVLFDGNLVGGGRAPEHLLVLDGGSAGPGCADPTAFTRNVFWYERNLVAPLEPADVLPQLVAADAGTFDARGNLFDENRGCFDAVQPTRADGGALPPFRLAALARCLDRSAWASRLDGSKVLLDLEGRPRDAGAAPDVGCSERP